MRAIELVRQLDTGTLSKLPLTAPMMFVPKELRRALRDQHGHIIRNTWEMGLALALKEALRSGVFTYPRASSMFPFGS